MNTQNSSNNLCGLRALVTGGATRVGRELSLGLAREGCDIIVHYSSNDEGAREVERRIREIGRNVCVVRADFTTREGPEIVADMALETGGLDILINNASTYPDGSSLHSNHSLEAESFEEWEDALAVNARAPFFLIQKLSSALKRSLNGNVINILDRSVSSPFVDRCAHTVSKSALATVTRLAAKALMPHVRVNGIELGAVLPGQTMSEEERSSRAWAGPEQVLATILFIVGTPFVNGEILGLRNGAHLTPDRD